ncbi:MAG: protein kinase [Elusimicrobia bacterium]|nr:protein kinase [Elusimicrobiota bacterium]
MPKPVEKAPPPQVKPAEPDKKKGRYDLSIPDVGVGKEIKEGYGQTQFKNRFARTTYDEPQTAAASGGTGDLLADARVQQQPSQALQQYAIPEVMRSEAGDGGAEKFAELSRAAGTRSKLGDLAGALAEADELIKLQPWNAEAHLYKANLLNQARRFSEAEEAAREAVRLDPKNAEAWKALGWSQLHQRKFAEAEKGLTQAIQLLEERRAGGEDTEALRNSLAAAYAMRAFAYEGLGQRDKMLADLEKAAKLYPKRFAGHLQRARAGEKLFDPDSADSWTLLEALPEGTEGGKSSPWPWVLLGLGVGTGGLFFTQRRRITAMFLAKDARSKRELDEVMKAEAAPAPQEGALLGGKYRLGALVTRDAAGEQWDALDTTLNRQVCVRRIVLDEAADPAQRERLRKEAQTAAALQHPNIIGVFEALDEPGGVFLIMEHAPGRTVEQILTKEGPLSPGRVRRILEGAAAALAYARSVGVAHPGLKASSIVVTDGGQVKVRDFSSSAGTGSDDAHALAACFYEMLTGAPLEAGAARFNQQAFRWPTQCRPGLPAAADQILARAVHPDPAQRFPGAAEFAASLGHLGPPEG